MNKEKSVQELLRAGLTEKQIEHLSSFRDKYFEEKQACVVAERHRLEFIRWLVTTGRLTERVA